MKKRLKIFEDFDKMNENDESEQKMIKKIEKQQKQIEEIASKEKIYEINKTKKKIKVLSIILASMFCVILLFFTGTRVLYRYSDGGLEVFIPNHQHVYSDEGTYHPGDCQNYGYTEYFCTVPYCNSSIRKYDDFLGPHRYNSEPEIYEDDEYIYYKYICSICGKENIIKQKKNIDKD